jgi:hypothetical protein
MRLMGLFTRSHTGQAPAIARRGKWKRRLLGLSFALLVLAFLSPIFVARTPLRNWVAARALASLHGQIYIGGASLGWFTPPVFTEVEVRDAGGRTLLRAPRIEGDQSLAALLCRPSDLGEFHFTRPELHVVCSGNSTNLETALADWLQRKDNQPDTGPDLEGIAVRARFAQASLILDDEDSGRKWALDPVDIALAIPHDRRTPIRLKVDGALSEQAGRLNLELAAHLVETSGGKPRVRVEGALHADNLPLAAAEPFLRRLEKPIKLDGRLDAHLTLRQGEGGPSDGRLQGNISLRSLTLGHPVLGSDCLRVDRAEVPCRLALEGSRLVVEQIEIQSELGKAILAGAMDLAKTPRDALTQPGHRLDATIDLARLAELVPDTLHLMKETRLTSGTLSLHVHSSAQPEGVFWEGDLHTSDLRGEYQGQRLVWKEPFGIVFTARRGANALPVLERFRCEADFLRLEMSGSLDEWTACGGFNLGRLGEHLAGLVDLAGLRVRGEGSFRIGAKRNPRGAYRLEGDAQVAQFNLSDPVGHSWREDRLTVRLDLVGEPAGASYRLSAGGLHLLAGQDGVDIDLLEPIPDLGAPHAARVRVRVHGDLARWQARLGSFGARWDGVRVAGQVEFDSRLRCGQEAVEFEDLKVAGRDVRFVGFGLDVAEPALDLTTSGRWSPEKETLELRQPRLTCPTVTVQAPAASIITDRAGAAQITADATVEGDASRLHHWFSNSPDSLGGSLAGSITLRPDDGRLVLRADLNIRDLTFGPPAAPPWREPVMHITAQGTYDLLEDSFRIGQIHLDCVAMTCDAAGQIAALHGDKALSLEGKLRYDLEKLTPLRTSLDPLVRELSVLLKNPAALIPVRENVVTFRVVNGRVYPHDLELHFPELTVRTSGSVGLDGSLALVAEMPVPPKWLGSSQLAGALAGQAIRLPIGGTLSRPKIDERALREAGARFARDAVENVMRQEIDDKLKKEVDNGLKKLLRPRR